MGAITIAEALKENTALTTLNLQHNDEIGMDGLRPIAKALIFNHTLSCLDIAQFGNLFPSFHDFVNTHHNLTRLLETLIGKDGAHVLGNSYRIMFRCLNEED